MNYQIKHKFIISSTNGSVIQRTEYADELKMDMSAIFRVAIFIASEHASAMGQRCIFGIFSARLGGRRAWKNVAALLTNCSNFCLFLADTGLCSIIKAERRCIGLELAYVQ